MSSSGGRRTFAYHDMQQQFETCCNFSPFCRLTKCLTDTCPKPSLCKCRARARREFLQCIPSPTIRDNHPLHSPPCRRDRRRNQTKQASEHSSDGLKTVSHPLLDKMEHSPAGVPSPRTKHLPRKRRPMQPVPLHPRYPGMSPRRSA